MKRVLSLIFVLLSLAACKGEKGEKGDSGNGRVFTYTGTVTSDSFFVPVPTYNSNSGVIVFIGDGSSYLQIPVYAAGVPINVYFLAASGGISIYNAVSGTPSPHLYKIVVIQ